jgi:1-deoxy-D-xylulose-5-phosphate reductoisomerase
VQRVAVLGSTGSIGVNSLEVLAAFPDRFSLAAITAHQRWQELASQTRRFQPRHAVVGDPQLASRVDRSAFASSTRLDFGPDAIEAVARDPETDIVVAAIVGAAGLRGAWSAVESGKRVCIANKETLVVAGPLVMELAARTGAELLPVDSEHSAIFQCLRGGEKREISRIILTASGGPFRDRTQAQLEAVTPAEALDHPTWVMGPKITVDSATLMNKALEVIEAKWLFGLRADQISVVVHPQSIVHSMVEFSDGSVIAQLSPPDMRLPIQYALTYPDRGPAVGPRMNWSEAMRLEFSPPDLERFPALALGFEVASRGGSSGCVLNAANEVAVSRFLSGTLKFVDIPHACRDVLQAHDFEAAPSLDALLRLDRWSREEMQRWSPRSY